MACRSQEGSVVITALFFPPLLFCFFLFSFIDDKSERDALDRLTLVRKPLLF